jgi:tetratricopeptide (TPR) repeat protein
MKPLLSLWQIIAIAVMLSIGLMWYCRDADEVTEQISPHHALMHFSLGKYQRLMGRADEALKNLQRAVTNDAGSFAVHTELGNVHTTLGDLASAEASYEKAISLDADATEALANLGGIRLQQGREADALALFLRVLEKEPQEISALNNVAWTLATSSQADLRDGAKAIVLAEKASQLTEARHPVILMTLAAAHAEAGYFDQAIQVAQKALTMAQAAQSRELVSNIEGHLANYRQDKPLRQQPSAK